MNLYMKLNVHSSNLKQVMVSARTGGQTDNIGHAAKGLILSFQIDIRTRNYIMHRWYIEMGSS